MKAYKRFITAIAVLILMFSAVGFATAQQDPTSVLNNMLAEAKAAVKSVSPEDLKAAIDNKENIIIIDVREPGEFAAGHLPGAINIPRGLLEFRTFSQVPDLNSKIYIYCKSGGRATLSTKTLQDLGYMNALLVPMEYADWVKAGYPVER